MTVRLDRRKYLLSAIPLLSVGFAGCTGSSEDGTDPSEAGTVQAGCSGEWSPSIEAEEPTLAPGDNTTLRIAITNVTGVNLWESNPGPSSVGMKFNSASLSPGPDFGSDGYPPGYGWDECTNVEITIPVVVPSNAEPGEYSFGVKVTPHDENPPAFNRNFTVTVFDN